MFLAERGKEAGEPFTRCGVLQLFERLGRRAKIQGVRCSPHTMRHAFAKQYMIGGGDIKTTQIYVAMLGADIVSLHSRRSPSDRI